jgi:hypothetical protein
LSKIMIKGRVLGKNLHRGGAIFFTFFGRIGGTSSPITFPLFTCLWPPFQFSKKCADKT